ncbi:hypothetical protein FQZ97_1071620 [compost metagenome]
MSSTDDPHLTVAQCLEVLGQAIEVENEVRTRADVLPHFVDDEDDVILARCLTGNFQHLLDTVILKANDLAGFGAERALSLEQIRVKLVSQGRNQAVHNQFIVAVVVPLLAPGHVLEQVEELLITPLFLQSALQRRDLEVA